MAHSLLQVVLLLLALSTLVIALLQRLGVSPVLGYLLVGVMAGPHALGWLAETPQTEFLAELGVVFLMFGIGLEFSLPRLLAAKRLVLGLGGAQVVVSALLFGAAAWVLGVSPQGAFAVGAALAMSSTAIVLKQLGEQGELAERHGRVAVGVLLFQDLAAVPSLVILPALAQDHAGLTLELAASLAKAAGLFVLLLFLGRRALRPALHWIARTRSLELFMLATLLLSLAAAWASGLAGLSPPLGAFMAGMLIGETEFRHQVEADVRPFRDLLLGLFFVTIGMRLDVGAMADHSLAIAVLLPVYLVAKLMLVAGLAAVFGEHARDAWRSGLSLAQAGEFGLLLITMAAGFGFLLPDPTQILFAVMVLSMALAPILVRHSPALARHLPGGGAREDPGRIAETARKLDSHVVICGFGRVGQNLARILAQERIPYLALDLDILRVRQASAAGQAVVYGNAGRAGVLQAAGVARARALAITVNDPGAAGRVAAQARVLCPDLPVLVRCIDDCDEAALQAVGVEVFPEGLEASLMFAGQLLLLLGRPHSTVERRLNAIRAEDYRVLRAFFRGSEEPEEAAPGYPEQLRSVTLGEGDPAAGRTAEELGLTECGVRLLDVRRGGIRVPGELLDTRLRAGDVVVLSGPPQALEEAAACLKQG